jgi:hypothetical protein
MMKKSLDHQRSTSASKMSEGEGDAFKMTAGLPDHQMSTSASQTSEGGGDAFNSINAVAKV